MSALQKRVLQSGLPPRPPISIGRGGSSHARRKKDYSAIHWSEHFDEKRHIKLDNGDTFCVYVGGVKQNSTESPIASDNTLPVIVLLHGGQLKELCKVMSVFSPFNPDSHYHLYFPAIRL